MRRAFSILLLAFLLGAPLAAQECTHDAQTCLDYLMQMRDRGFAGVDLDAAGGAGWPITKVYPDTPAARAGIRVGDSLVAIAGVRLGDEEGMKKLDEIMKPGNSVRFRVLRDGEERDFQLELVRMPDDVFARFVGEHMLLHATVDVAASD